MWMNNFTGEIYNNLFHAIRTILSDMIRVKACRTLKMLNISRY